MVRVLAVDDDPVLLRALEKLFRAEGYHCETAPSAAAARRLLAESEHGRAFSLLVLDVGLPDQDGFALCRQIRTRHHMPILMLTARAEVTEKVVGLEVGADDYVTKPFDPRELLARVRALLRRTAEYGPRGEDRDAVRFGSVVFDTEGRAVVRNSRTIPLTDREYELLYLLARHRNKALASDWIMEQVWGYEADFNPKTLTVCIQRLRRKIEDNPSQPTHLVTIRGFGYKLVSGP